MRHRRGGEAPQNRVQRFHFFHGHGVTVVMKREEVAHIDRVAAMLQVAVLLVQRVTFAPIRFARMLHGGLQRLHDGRIVSVQFAFALELVEAGAFQFVLTRISGLMPRQHDLGDFIQADTVEVRSGAVEKPIDDLAPQADDFENLRAAIRIDRADAHLRHDLQQAVFDGVQIILDGFVGLQIAADVRRGGQRQIRIHRRRAVTDEHRKVMGLARLAAFDDEVALHAQIGAQEMIVDRAQREDRRDESVIGIGAPIAQHQHLRAFTHFTFRSIAQALDGAR